ncbi:DUF6542 domain-containing protein [Mycolicibacterium aichiense]|uniref:DUF6542 domain-containing protein n=1 Tax=Mycolicibacterium aichiense TaxID=1799 RepID=A0AAD1HRD7_9MYCO|nr:DUF6542 domain-containing protein [Mycolicibacterium aichiense]BBX09564.1 hypothetical protein MAIC_43670 [Mycolicibacterium aichiense]SUA14129.1 Conserved membrane protein of uncharacterised function [Mycolicibacterium aichiense]
MAPAHRSAHPNLSGVPWWAAVLIAVIATTIGFAFDAGSGNKELGNVFAAMYALGCVAAVLAVRHSSIFTAVIQPPLILFVMVPGSYFLFHGAAFTGVKDTLINFGYPLIERFPLMLFTSAGVLLIGLVRWYFGMSAKSSATARHDGDDETAAGPGLFAGLAAKFSSVLQRGDVDDDDDDADEAPKRKHGIDRPATAQRRPRSERPAKRPAPTRSRHARPPLEDITEAPERPRRQSSRRRPVDAEPDALDYPETPRRRRQPPRDPNSRTSSRREPREPREPREARDRRDPYGSPPRRSSRFEPYEPYPSYEPYPPYEPPTRQRPPGRTNGDSDTHHPVSRVRYRGDVDPEPGRQPRSRRPSANDWDAESWRPDR